ncbi:B12-binding domain-containing radical SAM protein [Nonomuraea jabiensis]|uniref:B12-binding domain-containing radical SAM protein n=1 Tax=Nonomuraea jabiensis TaxID=882448 RepID=UPI003D741402
MTTTMSHQRAAVVDEAWGRRLITAVEHATGLPLSQARREGLLRIPASQPNALRQALAQILPGQVSVTGTLEQRLLVAERAPELGGWTFADLQGRTHAERDWPAWTAGHLMINHPGAWLSGGRISAEGAERLQRPRVLLASLYHPEWFPLPRFPLAISDLARAARRTLLGQIALVDMQLQVSFTDLLAAIATTEPDIVGVSATFGQHDLMIALLDHLYASPTPPLVLAGGSLTVRNEALLLETYPRLLVARGAGETTIADALSHYHGDLLLADIPGLGYAGAARGGGLTVRSRRRTAKVPNARLVDFLPELDLLEPTLECRGVAQVEGSRGCTSACSFCPRGHKGVWAPGSAQQLGIVLPELTRTFDRHPETSKTLYLVDEEFFGRDEDAVCRALEMANLLHGAGFAWESSCRIDQVSRPERGRDWHLERARMWRRLNGLGLRRMLFGVESGVDSILARFNKDTTGEQNALAIRTLSALGVPTRFTYITFDHLMDLDELRATHAFQGRTDLLLAPQPQLSVEEIVDGVRDPSWVAAHTAGRPFHIGISYMLVSMECLIGAAYTRAVAARALTGAIDPSMGRVEARFADQRIGACSRHAQMWVDRTFALDYTLKSLEKIVDGQQRAVLHGARVTIRASAYALLTAMLALIESTAPTAELGEEVLCALMDEELRRLQDALSRPIGQALPLLSPDNAELLHAEHRRWLSSSGWRLINAADACGT